MVNERSKKESAPRPWERSSHTTFRQEQRTRHCTNQLAFQHYYRQFRAYQLSSQTVPAAQEWFTPTHLLNHYQVAEESLYLSWHTNCYLFRINVIKSLPLVCDLYMLFKANKTLLKWKSKTGSTSFPQLGKPLNIVCYLDATYASLEDESSEGGFIIFVYDNINRIAPMCWSSKKLDKATKSPLASENLVFIVAADAGV